MTLDLYLDPEELATLKAGGFLTLALPDGVRVIIKKDKEGNNDGE